MLRPELVDRVIEQTMDGKAGQADRALIKATIHCVFDQIVSACCHGEQVSITGFGKFYPRMSAQKRVASGLQKQYYTVPKRLKMKFRSSETAERKLNKLWGMMQTADKEVNKSVKRRTKAD